MNDALIDELRLRADRLSAQAMDVMFKRPFWLERFGEHGRKNSYQDSSFHMAYLLEALTSDEPEVIRRYATWLRGLLNSHGMCTRHLDDNFEQLQAVISREVASASAAVSMLQEGRNALVYAEGPGRALQLAAPALVRAVLASATSLDADDVADHLSYLADAAELRHTERLVKYVQFMQGAFARRGAAGRERELLQAIAAALETAAPETREAAAKVLAAALAEVTP
ncbi:MAG: hypothetical protein JNK82_27765 [Myxococcaceae bacterium]|nr:hypothetical protein [Myxococcaceae bacterium]